MQLASQGWRCALVGRRKDRLGETAAQIRSRFPNAETLVLPDDIGEPAAADRIVSAVEQKWGSRVDALVNNAAALHIAPIHDTSDHAMRDTFEINAFAPMRFV